MKARRCFFVLAAIASLAAAGPPGRAEEAVDYGKVDQVPVPVHQVPPVYPLRFRFRGVEGKVIVEFLVDVDGTVKSAHAQKTSHPEFDAAAVAAVGQWVFKPGRLHGRAVITRCAIPIEFHLSAEERLSIPLAVGPLRRTENVRTREHGVILTIIPTGEAASAVRAGRILVTHATDSLGGALTGPTDPQFHHESVGRVDDSPELTSREPIQVTLWGVTVGATAVSDVEGSLELFVPDQDPDATAEVDHLASKFGSPLQDPALTKSGVTLVAFDYNTAQKMYRAKTAGGPQDFDSGPMFGLEYLDPNLPPAVAKAMQQSRMHMYDHYPPEFAARLRAGNEMGLNDIAVGIQDPAHRVVAVEFQAADGSALRYNHNGRYHAGLGPDRRFHVFALASPLPPDAELVCWMLTEHSVTRIPLKLANLPLPAVPFVTKPNESLGAVQR